MPNLPALSREDKHTHSTGWETHTAQRHTHRLGDTQRYTQTHTAQRHTETHTAQRHTQHRDTGWETHRDTHTHTQVCYAHTHTMCSMLCSMLSSSSRLLF